MARQTPLDVFEDNVRDAERLVHLARVLANTRKNRMRTELRESFGASMGLARKKRDELDCVESDELFIVIKPQAKGRRELFTESELRPLLRQAVVATAAAVESYVAEKSCCYIGQALRSDELPKRLMQMSVNLGQIIAIERQYERRGWGHRQLVRDYLVSQSSSSPSQIGQVFSVVGHGELMSKLDGHRRVSKGTSNRQLEDLTARRNRIAHAADRLGNGRAHIEIQETAAHLANAKSIVESLDALLP
ncbi:MAG: HEPN domain-containing protein [Solirubrobacteraceae bacterium]